MESSASLRPGVALGGYPERSEERRGRLDALFEQLFGRVRPYRTALGRLTSSRSHRFMTEVSARQQVLSNLSQAARADALSALRQRLFARGLSDTGITEGFAFCALSIEQTLGLRLRRVQILGARAMLSGAVAEMATGEGKTLAATLPAAVAALAGIPVHVITVNDYLVRRDVDWMGPVYAALGLSVGLITEGLSHAERRAAYRRDVVYCTGKQLVFDYLRDQVAAGRDVQGLRGELRGLHPRKRTTDVRLLRGLCFAIVDEADSVLIDEARTPLILSRAGEETESAALYRDAIDIASALSPEDYHVRREERTVELTALGIQRVAQLAQPLGGQWVMSRQREMLARQALTALLLFERDRDYLVKNQAIHIIDASTGRVLPDRTWREGLHQLIETKEGCPITQTPETIASISYQRFFRRYLKLAGMTGTARAVAPELWSVYRLDVIRIPTHAKVCRRRLRGQTYRRVNDKWNAVVARTEALQTVGRPVLIGTNSVADSEVLSERLSACDIEHQVLNARQHEHEAEVIANAGQSARVTVATNMAGRGTDIKLSPAVAALGGLHVILTQRHDSRRIDLQFAGRCARQGDPGSVEYILSVEDDVTKAYSIGAVRRLFGHGRRSGWRVRWLGPVWLRYAQRRAERRDARARAQLLRLDERLRDVLAFAGGHE